MSLPFIKLTPETIGAIVKTDDNHERRARWARVYSVLFGVRAYNDGDIDATELTKWLDTAFEGSDDDNIGSCLG